MISSPAFSEIFELARDSSAPGDWSRAVSYSRSNEFFLEKESAEAIRLRVIEQGRPLGMTLILDLEAGDWQIDCSCADDPCVHVLSAVIALKNEVNLKRSGEQAGEGTLSYRLALDDGRLSIERRYLRGGTLTSFPYRLQDYVGGLQSGRYEGPAIHPAKEDFDLERSLAADGSLQLEKVEQALRALKELPEIELPAEVQSLSAEPVRPRILVAAEGSGYRVKRIPQDDCTEYRNGAVLRDGVLSPSGLLSLPQKFWRAEGVFYGVSDVGVLSTEDIPLLRRFAEVQMTVDLPEYLSLFPEVTFHLERQGRDLHVTPHLVYGNPVEARLVGESLEYARPRVFVQRNLSQEKALMLKLQNELHLRVGQTTSFSGEAAVKLREQLEGWQLEGSAKSSFSNLGVLEPQVVISEDELRLDFLTPEGESETSGRRGSVSFETVWEAWQSAKRLVPLANGQWAEVPGDWLSRFAPQITRYLALRDEDSSDRLSQRRKLMLIELGEEMEVSLPEDLQGLRDRMLRLSEEHEPALPEGLEADLRHYQVSGVAWLQTLQRLSLGAVLADDMGLGKTLQAICVLKPRSLVVCPTSVIDSWMEQIAGFRPDVRVCRYHGGQRSFDAEADVVLTSYALMRLDAEVFSEHWSVLVLDESQNIKNAGSATAQAAFSLSADFKLAISGTPIENNLDDLWSQFHFVFPELLGKKSSFDQQFKTRATEGSETANRLLSRRIAPFILRRRKQDVEKELPPKTEVVLACDLDEYERNLYQAIYLSSKSEVIKALGQQGGMIKALEALLRLRQVCCHPALLPEENAATSSKLELLIERLLLSKASGHRCLVFSQWTSCLDLIEQRLPEHGLSFLRLDGSTRNRQTHINAFQQEDGPDLMLLSLKAGGVGITLTAADHVYLFDSWWNPSVEDQAADRAHRIGQSRPVLVHRLIARYSIEESILELQKAKRELAEDVLSGAGAEKSVSVKDIEFLFSRPG